MKSAKAKPDSEVDSRHKGSVTQRSKTGRRYCGKSATLLAVCVLLLLLGPLAYGAQNNGNKVEFLVARRQIHDPIFYHSVVLMLPSARSPLIVGLIVNRPTHMTLGKLFPDSPEFSSRTETAYFGGPVSVGVASLLFHSHTDPGHALRVFGDVYLTFDPNVITSVFKGSRPGSELRMFLGRSQWGHNQLQDEMHEGAWYRIEAPGSIIFSMSPQSLWRVLHSRAAPSKYIRYQVPAKGAGASSQKTPGT